MPGTVFFSFLIEITRVGKPKVPHLFLCALDLTAVWILKREKHKPHG
jgi:hypothetical protein